jgi:hypothetical protein
VVAVVLGALALGVAFTASAQAHDPLFLTEDDRTPATGPLLPDGTISFALYGEIGGEGDSRGLQVRFQEGEALFVELLVPDDAPENLLEEAELPSARIVAPDGTEVEIGASLEGSFFEPFTSTSYLRLGSVSDVAIAGTYDIWITGPTPARFTIAVGTREAFGTPVERVDGRPGSFTDLSDALDVWLETPPGLPPAGAATPDQPGTTGSGAEPPGSSIGDGGMVPPEAEADPSVAEAAPPTGSAGDDGDTSVIIVVLAATALGVPAGLGWFLRRWARENG